MKVKQRVLSFLWRKDVEIIDTLGNWFKCKRCSEIWSPNFLTGGRQPRGYWQCPQGCNKEEEQLERSKRIRLVRPIVGRS